MNHNAPATPEILMSIELESSFNFGLIFFFRVNIVHLAFIIRSTLPIGPIPGELVRSLSILESLLRKHQRPRPVQIPFAPLPGKRIW